MPSPKKNSVAPKQKLIASRTGKERLSGQDVLTLLDNINDIVPLALQSYSINGEKSIDQKNVLRTIAKRLRNNVLRTTYLYSKSSKSHGRQYAREGISVQSLSRVLRHTLCSATYRDFDIVNCHPSIALQYCQKRGWAVPFLNEYVNNRAVHLEKLMEKNKATKDDIKTMILAVLNGGRKLYNETKHKTPFITGLFEEVNDVFLRMMDEASNQSLIEEVKGIKAKEAKGKDVSPHTIRRSVCNRVWVDIENALLNTCMDWCVSVGVSLEFVILMFDGFMLPKTEAMPENWAEAMSDFVHEKMEYRMSFMEKPMDEGVDITEYTAKTLYTEPVGEVDEELLVKFCLENTDAVLAELCGEAFGKKYKYDGDQLYTFHNHRWTPDGDVYIYGDVKRLRGLIEPLKNHEELVNDKIDYVKNALKAIDNDKRTKSMRNFFHITPGLYDKEFASKLDMNRELMGFNNGVYDLVRKVFRDGMPEDMISLTTGYDFVRVSDWSDADRFISDIVDAETVTCLKGHLAGILHGGNDEQRFNFWIGGGGNGKTVLTGVMDTLLGQYFTGVPKEVYTKEKKHAGGGEPHLVKLKGSRMALVCETDDGDKFLTSVFKATSGGDTIECRALFSNNVIKYKPMFKPILMTNHLPQFSSPIDDGTARRLRLFNFPYKFVDNPMNEPDENGLIQIVEKKRDYDMGNFVKTDDFRNQFLNMLLATPLSFVESPSMTKARETYMTDLNPVGEWFYEMVKPTRKLEDKISTADLLASFNEWNDSRPMDQRKKTLTSKMFGEMIGRLVKVQYSRIETKQVRCIVGYQIVPREDDE
jgi:phage/plasmid-associated DNA primase